MTAADSAGRGDPRAGGVRAFAAFEPPAGVRNAAAAFSAALRGHGVGGRHVGPAHMHITAAFFGAAGRDELRQIARTLQAQAEAARLVAFRLRGLGTFGRPPRVLYMDFEDVGGAGAAVAAAFAPFAAPDEARRPWRPHLTLARFRTPAESATARLASRAAPPAPLEFKPVALTLFRSEPAPGGPAHIPIETVPLDGS